MAFDDRPMVTFLDTGHRCCTTGTELSSTKLYCLVAEAHVCEQLAQGSNRLHVPYVTVEQLEVKLVACQTL